MLEATCNGTARRGLRQSRHETTEKRCLFLSIDGLHHFSIISALLDFACMSSIQKFMFSYTVRLYLRDDRIPTGSRLFAASNHEGNHLMNATEM